MAVSAENITRKRTSNEVQNRYKKRAFDMVHFYIKKGQLPFLKQLAKEHNTSVTAIMKAALSDYLKKEYDIDINNYPLEENETE